MATAERGKIMDGGALFFLLLLVVIFFSILYYVIKAAVRNGIIEARNGKSTAVGKLGAIAQVVCPSCQKEHDIDYPECPHCGYSR